MAKTITLIWQFYRPLLIFNLLFSFIGLYDLAKIGSWFLANSIAIKMTGYAGSVFYKHYFANKSYVYYMNAGFGIKKMYTYVFITDMSIYLIMVAALFLFEMAF